MLKTSSSTNIGSRHAAGRPVNQGETIPPFTLVNERAARVSAWNYYLPKLNGKPNFAQTNPEHGSKK